MTRHAAGPEVEALVADPYSRLMALLLGAAALVGCHGAHRGATTLDLVSLLPVAEVRAETELIRFGTSEGRAHLGEGWSHDEDGFIWGTGGVSTLRFFVVKPRPVTLVLTCSPFDPLREAAQVVRTEVNGRPVGTNRLEPGVQELRIQVREDQLLPGDNQLRFTYAYSRRPADLVPGSTDRRALAVAWREARFLGLSGTGTVRGLGLDGEPCLEMNRGTRVDYFLELARGARLQVDAITTAAGADCRVVVELEQEGSGPVERVEWPASSRSGPRRTWRLPLVGKQVARLSFAVVAEDTGERAATLCRPRLVAPAAPPPSAISRPRWSADSRPNVLVYVIDALCADHLGVYGYSRPTTPRIDDFAAGALVFERAYAQASWTRPAVASLLTGTYPEVHGVNGRHDGLGPDLPTMADLFARAGYQTAAITTNGNVGPHFGFGRGFDSHEVLAETRSRDIHQLSDRLNTAVFNWFGRRDRTKPFLLYLHATDPHAPYTPHEPFRSRLAPSVPDDVTLNNPADRDHLLALYDAEIAFNDEHFGQLMDFLREQGVAGDTMVVLLADHGEAFYDHHQWQHGTTLYEEEVRIPLLLKLPSWWDSLSPGRVEALCGQVDVLPTLLEVSGLTVPSHLQGRSLVELALSATQQRPDQRAVFAHLEVDQALEDMVVRGDLKLLARPPGARGGAWSALFDLSVDPAERSAVPPASRVSGGLLAFLLRQHRLGLPARHRPTRPEVDPQTREMLRLLGYSTADP